MPELRAICDFGGSLVWRLSSPSRRFCWESAGVALPRRPRAVGVSPTSSHPRHEYVRMERLFRRAYCPCRRPRSLLQPRQLWARALVRQPRLSRRLCDCINQVASELQNPPLTTSSPRIRSPTSTEKGVPRLKSPSTDSGIGRLTQADSNHSALLLNARSIENAPLPRTRITIAMAIASR